MSVNIPRTGISDYAMTLVNSTLLSRSGLSSSSTSEDTRLQREQQAEALAAYLSPLETAGDHVMVLGGFDSFEFADGYVDALGILDGLESSNTDAGAYVWTYDGLSSSLLVDTTTASPNLTATAAAGASTITPATSRYTYVENGSAEQPDHILISSEMSSLVAIDYARFAADFPDSLTYSTSGTSTAAMVKRASTHDGIVAYFTIPYPTTTTVVTSLSPSVYDQSVTFTATVVVTNSTSTSTTPDGTVTFYDGTTKMGTGALSGGLATYSTSALAVGAHTIIASYGGSETGLGFEASSGTVQQVVNQDVTTLTLTGAPNPSVLGQPVTFTATASSPGVTPSGIVTFSEGTATLGTGTLSGGVATLSYRALALGTHTITATYGGDTTNTTATASTSQQVNTNTSTLALTATPATVYYGHSVILAVTARSLSGVPGGSVSFLVDGVGTYSAVLVIGASSSTASLATSALSVGTHTITAHYGGDGTHDAADSAAATVTVLATYATNSTLSCSPLTAAVGTTISCTDAISASTGQPSGTVTYYDGSTALGTTTATNGAASFSMASLPVGAHTITAVYAENDPYLASISNAQSITILSTFALSILPTARSIYTGEAASYTVTVTPGTDFTLDVALTCSGQPSNSTCTLSPTAVTGGTGTSKLTIQSTAPQQSSSTAKLERGGGALLAGLLVFCLPRRWRRRSGWMAQLLIGLVMSTLSGCGGSGTLTGGTPAGSYTVTVTGTSSVAAVTITESATTTLTVKSLF
jgi:hypothetical protein